MTSALEGPSVYVQEMLGHAPAGGAGAGGAGADGGHAGWKPSKRSESPTSCRVQR